jgi:AraC-like DNA-binding protein
MPIYLDRHEVHNGTTAEHVAKMHLEDLKIEHKYNCRGLTYWCDEIRRTAFCLIEAPNKQAIQNMHNHAHGAVAHNIIEVESTVVESFLGRILDPVNSTNSELNIINDTAFRILMVFNIQRLSLIDVNYKHFIKNYGDSIFEKAKTYKASIVKHKKNCFLASFDSVTNAISCAIEIQTIFNEQNSNVHDFEMKLNIGISAGIPITDKNEIFEDAVKTAERLSNIVKEQIVITTEVKELFESENLNTILSEKITHTLSNTDENFLNILMDYIDSNWSDTTLKIDDLCKITGCSKSMLYRRINAIMGISPNVFIKEYRLNEALKMLINQDSNVSEIAFRSGFNTPAYFSKRFKENYGILPSEFLKQNA